MSSSLRQTLNQLASSFAADVLSTIRSAPLEDVQAGASAGGRPALSAAASRALTAAPLPEAAASGRRRGGRLPRRSSDDIERVVASIVFLLKQSPRGLRAEQIREGLGLQAKELPRPLKEALESGKLSRSGQKRATTYFAKAAGSSPAGARGRRARPGRAVKRGK
jgi:hypothetical protein